MPAAHAPSLQGRRLVSGIEADSSGGVKALVSRDAATGEEERHEADAVVFAISISGGRLCWELGDLWGSFRVCQRV